MYSDSNNKPFTQRKKRKPIYDAETGIPPTEEQNKRMAKQAKNVSIYWLSRTAQPRKKLYEKIMKKGITEEVANQVLDEFEKKGLIDDLQFAQNFVESKMRYEKYGTHTIRQKLMLKGIPRDIIEVAMEDIEEEAIEENALILANKKLKSTQKFEPYQRAQKITTYLAGRGYPFNIALKAAKQAIEEDDQEVELDITYPE